MIVQHLCQIDSRRCVLAETLTSRDVDMRIIPTIQQNSTINLNRTLSIERIASLKFEPPSHLKSYSQQRYLFPTNKSLKLSQKSNKHIHATYNNNNNKFLKKLRYKKKEKQKTKKKNSLNSPSCMQVIPNRPIHTIHQHTVRNRRQSLHDVLLTRP